MTLTGNDLFARTLVRQGTKRLFVVKGAPILEASTACAAAGIRMIDVRHEQAAAMMAHASARVLARLGVCLAAAGPGSPHRCYGGCRAPGRAPGPDQHNGHASRDLPQTHRTRGRRMSPGYLRSRRGRTL